MRVDGIRRSAVHPFFCLCSAHADSNVNCLLAGIFAIEIGMRPRSEAPLASHIDKCEALEMRC